MLLLPGFEQHRPQHDQGDHDDDEPLADHGLVNRHPFEQLLVPVEDNDEMGK